MKKLNQILKAIILISIIIFGIYIWNYPKALAEWNDEFWSYKKKEDIIKQKIELQKLKIYMFEKQYRIHEMKRLYK